MVKILPPSLHPGRTEIFTGSNPPLGNDAEYTVPDGYYLDIVTISWEYICTAGAVRMALQIFRPPYHILAVAFNGNFNAGTYECCAMAGVGAQYSYHTTGATLPLPWNLQLRAGDYIRTFASGINALDSMSRFWILAYPQRAMEP